MEEKKMGFIAWVKAHKKQLLFAGLSVTAIIGVIIGLKNKETLVDLWASLEKSIRKVPEKLPELMSAEQMPSPAFEEVIVARSYTSPQEAFDVSRHIRTMAAGKHHSVAKAEEALALGIDLLPNQTLVESYTKYAA